MHTDDSSRSPSLADLEIPHTVPPPHYEITFCVILEVTNPLPRSQLVAVVSHRKCFVGLFCYLPILIGLGSRVRGPGLPTTPPAPIHPANIWPYLPTQHLHSFPSLCVLLTYSTCSSSRGVTPPPPPASNWPPNRVSIPSYSSLPP